MISALTKRTLFYVWVSTGHARVKFSPTCQCEARPGVEGETFNEMMENLITHHYQL